MGSNIESPQVLTEPFFPNDTIDGDQGEPLQGIYEQSETQNFKLGTLLVYRQLGLAFRYGKVGGSGLSKALMTQAPALDAKLVDEAQATSFAGVTVGDTEIIVDITTGITSAEDDLAGARMVVNKVDGIGDVYNIIASKVQTSDVLLRLLLDSDIRTAFAATTEITIRKNPGNGVIVYPTSVTGVATGVPLIDMTTLFYGWFQTKGSTPILADSSTSLALGEPVGVGASAGTCDTAVTVKAQWGHCEYAPASSECAIIKLNLD